MFCTMCLLFCVEWGSARFRSVFWQVFVEALWVANVLVAFEKQLISIQLVFVMCSALCANNPLVHWIAFCIACTKVFKHEIEVADAFLTVWVVLMLNRVRRQHV